LSSQQCGKELIAFDHQPIRLEPRTVDENAKIGLIYAIAKARIGWHGSG